MLGHAVPSRETQLAALKLERELLALFAQHAEKPPSSWLKRQVHNLVSAETARVERAAKGA